HDLARLAVAALRHVDLGPGFLHHVRSVARQALDGDHAVGGLEAADRDRARTYHLAVEVHRAGAALRHAAAVLGSGEPGLLAQRPQEWRVVLDRHLARFSVDVQFRHGDLPLVTAILRPYMLRRYCPPTSNSACVICPSEHTRTASIRTANTFSSLITASRRRRSIPADLEEFF